MALINLDESFSVKVAEIEQQHKKPVSMINEISDAMKQRKVKEVLEKIVNGLVEYALTHFKTEEKYFTRFGYPDTESHKKEHNDFVQKVKDFKDGFEKGKLTLSVEVMNFLSDWLQNHIKGTDKKVFRVFQ